MTLDFARASAGTAEHLTLDCLVSAAVARNRVSQDDIPSSGGGESIISVAARVRANRDIFEARKTAAVQPGVEEPERRLTTLRKQVVTEPRSERLGARRWMTQIGRYRPTGADLPRRH